MAFIRLYKALSVCVEKHLHDLHVFGRGQGWLLEFFQSPFSMGLVSLLRPARQAALLRRNEASHG